MIAEASMFTAKAKLTMGTLAVVALGVADTQAIPLSIEDYSIRGGLTVGLIFTVRLLLQTLKEHKAEMKELRDKHEERLATVIESNTESNRKVCQSAEEQLTYFKTVTRDIVNEKLHARQPEHPPIP